MGSIFSRVKNWAAEKLTNEDLNAEIDNILDNFEPAQMDDYSTNVAEMQTTADPGEVGSESLATTLAGELARLRFSIGEIKGTTQWYTSGSSTISELTSALGGGLPNNRIVSGASSSNSSQPTFLDPAISTNTLTLLGATTNLIYAIEGTQYTISSDVTATGLTSAPTSNNTALVNDAELTDGDETKYTGEYGWPLVYDTAGSEITNLDGKLAAFKVNNGSADEYFIARVDNTNSQFIEVRRGYFFDGSQNPIPRVAIANNDTITLMKLTWVFANTAGALVVTYNEPTVSADQPSSPATGDYWLDLANDKWKYFNSAAWVDADATLIGVCIQDESGNTVGARAFDFFKDHRALNTVQLDSSKVSNTQVESVSRENLLKVYGTTVRIENDYIVWDITADLESGVTEGADTIYYMYITEGGDRKISDIAPYDRRGDLLGWYHPYETWRYVGQINNNGSSNFDADTLIETPESGFLIDPHKNDYKFGGYTVYTATDTWYKRAGLRALIVEVYGGGGGGGGADGGAGSACGAGAGGGGGGCSIKFIRASELGWSETVTVGAAGTAGAASGGGNGGTGGTGSFGSHCSATGGSGGDGDTTPTSSDSSTGAGGSGGTGSSGDLNFNGTTGQTGHAYGVTGAGVSGSGGRAGGPHGGNGGGQKVGNGSGSSGLLPGGGGSGACVVNNVTDRPGAVGGAGLVIVYEYY